MLSPFTLNTKSEQQNILDVIYDFFKQRWIVLKNLNVGSLDLLMSLVKT
jgi:hypothetical protein